MYSNTDIITRFKATDTEPVYISTIHGELVYYSNRSPKKNTPNEDALAVIPVDDETIILVVADGIGGMSDGEEASKIVIQSLISAVANIKSSVRESILDGIDEANEKISSRNVRAGTTVSIAELSGNKLRTYHAGDSLILLTDKHGDMRYESLSHSPVGYGLMCGAFDKEQAMKHPERNLIYNYVGCEDNHINIGPVLDLSDNDTLILSSDALPDNIYNKEICKFICKEPLLDAIGKLIDQCNLNMEMPLHDRCCHPDDFTLISFRKKIEKL